MKVTISVCGKFHAFQLAKCLEKRGFLDRIITHSFYFDVADKSLPKERIVSLPLIEILQRAWGSMHFLNERISIDRYVSDIFDKQASRCIRPCDIFVGWSGFSLRTLRKAKSMGLTTVIERCSSHIENQRDILKEEYGLLGIKPMLPHPYIVEKELNEYSEADYISTPSQFAKKTFLDRGIPENKLICVPYGVDTQVFKPVPKKDNVFRIIYVGAMSVRKGINYLLRAISELKLKNSETWLIGCMHDEVKSFFKKYRDVFKYLGHINHNQLYKYYSQGSLFILPSIEEGLAHVILQASACGLPVICSTNTGGADVIRDGKEGFIVPIRNIDVLKEKILFLYEHPEVAKAIGQEALNRVRKEFKWSDYGEKIIGIYEKNLI